MKFAIPAIGTRGDVQPYIALVSGLQDEGHAVTVASHPCMQALVAAHGVSFASVGPDVGKAAAAIRGR
jgi:sterol 3beta-glucosyltransferase